MGVIAKRPLGNAPWRFSERPGAQDVALYWDRMRQMALDPHELDWSEFALRFRDETVMCSPPPALQKVLGADRLRHAALEAADGVVT